MIERLLCWLGLHDWQCIMRRRNPESEVTRWKCFRANCIEHGRIEQWDESGWEY